MLGHKATMDLSILIPVYNWDATRLLKRIFEENKDNSLGSRVEIIVLDDCSTDTKADAVNVGFLSEHLNPNMTCEKLDQNLGRSAIRNLLASKASGNFLLFLDCDVLPDTNDFIGKYLSLAEENNFDVVCGGISYRTRILNEPEYDYHAYLGNRKEVKSASERNKEPWRHILTSNIMVRKSVFQATPFNERFTGYGYEDIEWGVRLAKKYRILHIDNTASHLGLVTKAKTYEKMCNSVPNYLLLREICPEAFAASAISKVAEFFERCNVTVLSFLDRTLKRRFLECRLSNRHAFILFQLNFAVLLALALKRAR
ncbi:MAG: glycosyltransferase family 2 protein [Geobacteraceae bacterium]|nr:glycosyltransferase family 2 protein [Geobacteraceae bacterium]NTW80255.1 glycosyltransferase family 2 protein [Geobacteraceae bacterium]